jgi:hypothetical protein
MNNRFANAREEPIMKSSLVLFSLMLIFACGTAYADDYGITGNDDIIETAEVQSNSYFISGYWGMGFVPMVLMPTVVAFDESGNFIAFKHHPIVKNYTGSYAQTGSTFTAHCEFLGMADMLHVFDLEGTSVEDTFIYGSLTGQMTLGEKIVMKGKGLFLGIALPSRAEVE